MYQRTAMQELVDLANSYPVVTVLGPRQSGKTTLVKLAFPSKPYINLEDVDTREIVRNDPRSFLNKYAEGAILDEIQRFPELLSYIQVMVDEHPSAKGLFILTGSHQLELHQAISQSLAGRTALLQLLPMSLAELADANINLSLDEALLKGGYPRIFKDRLNPSKAYRNYLQTYIEKDVRQLINIKDMIQFQRFMRICAGRIGQLLNVEGIAGDIGVSSHTIRGWLSTLESSFVIFRLAPYYENFGKRLIKSSKLYFTDVGLASYLLGIENVTQISRDPLRGSLVENLVILELVKYRLNQGKDPQLYYFRDAHGHEVDAVFQTGHQLIPIEIKSATTFNSSFLKNLSFFEKLVGERCNHTVLIYGGSERHTIHSCKVLPYLQATEALCV